ncbi:MAG: GNAT family N-acetyltransferase [Anaerolineales bacterium]|nr:GNAT family N-acetyltransferase [Anaerolineales bacterium]
MKQTNTILHDFGNGLIVRNARSEDTDRIADFNSRVHSDDGWEKPEEWLGYWTRDLMLNPPPGFNSDRDVLIVEDTQKDNLLVSTTLLIPQTWVYETVPFKVGRPELVGTHPDYRNRGLIKKQFEIMHQWCNERGMLVQGITGIPFYYRLFGYEMTIDLDGGITISMDNVPMIGKEEEESIIFRNAEKTDLSFIQKIYEYGSKRNLIHTQRSEGNWEYEIFGKSEKNLLHGDMFIIQNMRGESIGYLGYQKLSNTKLTVTQFELAPDHSWLEVIPAACRFLKEQGLKLTEAVSEKNISGLFFTFGSSHPVYQVFVSSQYSKKEPYSWYIRVPDMVAFLQQIKPVLEDRVKDSLIAGHTGDIKIDFYTDGVKLDFKEGKITSIQKWKSVQNEDEGLVHFPFLTFIQILFGSRSYWDIAHAYTDCFGKPEAMIIMDTLFPKKPSYLNPIA